MARDRAALFFVALAAACALATLSALHYLQRHHVGQQGAGHLPWISQHEPQEGPEIDRLQRQVDELQSRIRGASGGGNAVGTGSEAWRQWRSVEDFPRDQPLFVSFSNAHYSDLMLNWVQALRVLDVPHMVVAFDRGATEFCRNHSVVSMPAEQQMQEADFRGSAAKFRLMGSLKPKMVLRLFEDYGFQTIVLADTDTVWLREPSSFLDAHPSADFFISTDCLSHRAEAEGIPNVPRCGHVPGSTSGNGYNTGMLILRRRIATLQIMREWHLRLATPTKEEEANLAKGWQMDDQLMLNNLIYRGQSPVRPTVEDPAAVWAFNSTLRTIFLPALLFANGHVNFLQHLPQKHHVTPYAVHATFQRGANAGKRSRLRSAGWWLLDEAPYYSEGNFMTYQNNVHRYIAETQAGFKGQRMAAFHKHMLGAAYQMSAFQHAAAIARVTNRTLVLPEFACWCDQDQVATVLESCVMQGSDMELPFACPADWLLHMPALDSAPLPYRNPGFLSLHEKVPRALRQSAASVEVVPRGAAPPLGLGQEYGAQVPMGTNQQQLQELLRPFQAVRILHWAGLQPGVFGGFSEAGVAASFDATIALVLPNIGWCCSGGLWEKQWDYVYHAYEAPRPFAGLPLGTAGTWVPPTLGRPTWCDKLEGTNVEFGKLANHPCSYWTADYGPVANRTFLTGI